MAPAKALLGTVLHKDTILLLTRSRNNCHIFKINMQKRHLFPRVRFILRFYLRVGVNGRRIEHFGHVQLVQTPNG